MPETTLSFAASSAILAFSSFFGVFLMLQRSAFRHSSSRPAITAMISFMLIGLTAIFDTVRYGFSLNTADILQHVINTVAFFIAPPLLTAALISIGWQKKWRNDVGWVLFFLSCLFFLLAKYVHDLNFYRTLMISCALIVSFSSVIKAPFRHHSSTLFLMIAIGAYAMGLLVISYFKTSVVFLRLDFFHYLTALGNLFLASGFFQLMRKGTYQKKAAPA